MAELKTVRLIYTVIARASSGLNDNLPRMKLFITGSTGKVGSRVALYLVEKGHDLRVLIRSASHANDARKRGWDVVQGDLSAPESLTSAMAGMDAVLHLAAFFRGATPDQIEAVNQIGTGRLAQEALGANVTRFVYTSTGLVSRLSNSPCLRKRRGVAFTTWPMTSPWR
jgi:nucleoside-diphosphate-sugar epimerase